MRHMLIGLALLMPAGCLNELDERWAAVNQQERSVSIALADMFDEYVGAAQDMADKKHTFQENRIREQFTSYLERHTHNGQFVGLDAQGNVAPVNVAALVQVISDRDAEYEKLRDSRDRWDRIQKPMRDAIVRYRVVVETSGRTEADILKRKQEADQLIKDVAKIAGGFASAMLISTP